MTTLAKTNPNTPIFLPNIDKMSKKELVKAVKEFMLPMSDPTKYKEMVKSNMPELVKQLDDKETMGTAMQQSSQEIMLAIVETLKKYHNFTDEKIAVFLKDLKGNITVVKELEEGGLSMLSDHSMKHIVEMVAESGVDEVMRKIAEVRYKKESMWKSGLEHPNVLEGSNIERRLQKPRSYKSNYKK